MRTPPPIPARACRRRGAALVIALAVMVLVTGLVVAILSRVNTERQASGGYASSVEARVLADTAVQLVQAQIGAAATQGTEVLWTSQPGLVRTFDDTGHPLRSYRLYSASQMQVDDAVDGAAEAAGLAGWFNSPAVYTDLNQPADADLDLLRTPDTWPILDPAAVGKVEGFVINGAPVGKFRGVTNPAPMPVRWLYVLRDGQLVAAQGSGNTATVPGASATNPITGRIAFWTDDDSCKVNVNTASEGTYWDIPRAVTPTEIGLANSQPTQREFQAYPGHPATTSLSAVWPELTRDQILALVPRIAPGGSNDGTTTVANASPIVLDQDRLYPTEEEVLFTGTRDPAQGLNKDLAERSKFFITANSRAPETNIYNLPKIAAWPLHANTSSSFRTSFDRLIAFCATLNGNPYYFQRQNPNSMSEDYTSISRNVTLYSYLQNLTSRRIPGFGGTLSGKFQDDRDQILTEIFDYIRTTNLDDGNLTAANRYASGQAVAGSSTRAGFGQVMPIEIGSTRGFGRIPTITEFGIWLISSGDASLNPPSPDPPIDFNTAAYNKALTADLTSDASAKTHEIRVDSAFVFEPFVPSEGYRGIYPDIEITISGLESWTIQGNAPGSSPVPMLFPSLAEQTPTNKGRYILSINPIIVGNMPWAGHLGLWTSLGSRGLRARNGGLLPADKRFTESTSGSGSVLNQQYPFVGEPVTVNVTDTNPSVTVSGGNLKVKIIHRLTNVVVQSYDIDFPSGTFPAPTIAMDKDGGTVFVPILNTFQPSGIDGVNGGDQYNTGYPDPRPKAATIGRFVNMSGFSSQFYTYPTTGPSTLSDILKSVVPTYNSSSGTQTADLRVLAMTPQVKTAAFEKHPLFDSPDPLWKAANAFTQQTTGWYNHFRRRQGDYPIAIAALGGKSTNLADMSQNYRYDGHPDTSYPVRDAQRTGDWDNGIVNSIDGPYLNKADEGVTFQDASHAVPYFNSYAKETFEAATFFSPNRIIPSPGMFGSLPTGVKRNKHWQTLLFRRQPGHPDYDVAAGGFSDAPDYTLLDLFWMPIVEPYAISEPFSTAGKINLNQQIIPFSYIRRETGMHAILKREKVIAIPNTDAESYNDIKVGSTSNYRRAVKMDETLRQLDFRFDNTDGTGLYAFRTPAEICDFHIVPDDATPDTTTKATMDTTMADYWKDHALTGDNSRERIYTTVYPRLTTKSNTYTVHFRVQSLKQGKRDADLDKWFEDRDVVTGEYRGSTTIERYIDPNNTELPDYAADPDAKPTLDSFYRWRQRAHRRFAP